MNRITFSEIMDFYPEHNNSVYDGLKNACRRGGLIPFVGAGLSAFCGYLGWPDVLRQLAKYIFDSDIRAEVEEMIAAGELVQAAQSIQDHYPRMLPVMQKIINYDKIKRCDEEKLCASAVYVLPYLFRDGLVMTTNFDRVLEEVYDRCHTKFGNVVTPYDLDLLTQLRQDGPHCLFKLHGDIGPEVHDIGRLIFAKAQYDKAYAKGGPLMQVLTQWFQDKKLLFLGCSLAMDRTMEVLQQVTAENPGLDHYAILACRAEDVQRRCVEMGDLGISTIYYPDQRHEAVRIVLERLLEDTNHAAYEELCLWTRKSAPVSKMTSRFMYNADYIAFVGREPELASLQEFCQHEQRVSWWAVTGPGGAGKSRLVYEFTNARRKDGWKVYWLRHNDYNNLTQWVPPSDRCIVVADDVQAYLQAVGNWMISLSACPRSEKLRLLLLERDGKDLATAKWAEQLQSDAPYDDTISSSCYCPDFLGLAPLSDEALKDIMADFAQMSGKPLTGEGHAGRLLETLKKIDSNLRRPMYALAITDAWCSGKDPTSWNKDQVLDELITHELKFYYGRLRALSSDKVTKEMRLELENLLAQSCLLPFLPLEQIMGDRYPKLCKRADKLDIDLSELLRQTGVVHTIKIYAGGKSDEADIVKTIEAVALDCPDLVKEYLVLRQAFDKNQLSLLLPEGWEEDPRQLIFLTQIVLDYPEKLRRNNPFWAGLFASSPKREPLVEFYSYLMLAVAVQIPEEKERALGQLSQLCEKFPDDGQIALVYAKGLSDLSKGQGEECAHSVERLKELYERFADDEAIAAEYAKGLADLSEGQDEECAHSIERLRKLYEDFTDSEEIAVEYASSLFYLSVEQGAEECAHSVEQLKELYERFSDSEMLAAEYAGGLFHLFIKQSVEERVHSVEKLRELYERFSDSEMIAVGYAGGMSHLSIEQSVEECVHSVDELRTLFERFPSKETIAEWYASTLVNLSCKQQEEGDVRDSLKQLERVFARHPQNIDIQLSYAMTRFNLTLTLEFEALEQEIDQLRGFLQAHPGANQEFQTALSEYFEDHPEHLSRYARLRL